MTSLAAAQPQCRRARARPRRGSTARRSASTSWVRPSSRSPSRWRWTAGIIKILGQMYPCPGELHVYGRTINDTHPFGRPCSVAEIMKESSNIGTAQIADQLGAKRQQAFLKKMGFLDPVAVELEERGRTLTPGRDWGPHRDDDGRFRPRASRSRRCTSRPAMRPCSTAASIVPRPCSRSIQTHPGGARAAAFSARTPATRCAPCSGWSSPRAPARRPMRPAIASAARPAPPKRSSAAAIRAAW